MKNWRDVDRRWGWLFLAPQTLGIAIFVVFPFAYSLVLAFADWNGLKPIQWVGFQNYIDQVSDPLLIKAVVNTLLIGAITVPVGLGIALGFAILLQNAKGRSFYLVFFFMPVVTSSIAVALIWQQLLKKDGILNFLMTLVIPIEPIDWLQEPNFALLALCAIIIWSSMGLNIVIFMAGLESIDTNVIEAGRIDGANSWSIFWRVKLPLLSPVVFFSTVVAFISSMQTFDAVYVLTSNAGPDNALRTIVYHIYDIGFGQFRFGVSSAAAVLLLLLTLVITLLQFRAQKRFVHYD
jgi:multiple sugar transport system permease protein